MAAFEQYLRGDPVHVTKMLKITKLPEMNCSAVESRPSSLLKVETAAIAATVFDKEHVSRMSEIFHFS